MNVQNGFYRILFKRLPLLTKIYDEMHENLGPRWVHGYCYALSEGATEYLIFKFILS